MCWRYFVGIGVIIYNQWGPDFLLWCIYFRERNRNIDSTAKWNTWANPQCCGLAHILIWGLVYLRNSLSLLTLFLKSQSENVFAAKISGLIDLVFPLSNLSFLCFIICHIFKSKRKVSSLIFKVYKGEESCDEWYDDKRLKGEYLGENMCLLLKHSLGLYS